MEFDVEGFLGAVTRSVADLTRAGKPVRAVTLERTYNTSAEDLWDALTNPERLPRWFLPVSGELKLHGRYQLEGNAEGTITACDAPHFLGLTWEFSGEMSWVEATIAGQSPARARLTLTHICPVDDFWRKYGPGAAGVGWEFGLAGLAIHLATGAERFDEAALTATAEGRAFIAGSSTHWGRAAVAAGADPTEAAAAAHRTTAFYLGEEAPEA